MRILYVTTSFPVYSETFLQREVRAIQQAGHDLRVVSLHRGEAQFEGMAIQRFSKWRLIALLWLLPSGLLGRRQETRRIRKSMTRSRPPSWLSLFENLLGLAAALVDRRQTEAWRPDVIHCVWASAPAAYGWMLSSQTGVPFTMGAHAYDLFEFGGDWMLREKLEAARLVHTSTDAGRQRLMELTDEGKVRMIRRGLSRLPAFKRPRPQVNALRIVCVARLVGKKGFPHQLAIYQALKSSGLEFEAQILGGGPLATWIAGEIEDLGLGRDVLLRGKVRESEVWETLAQSDVLFHTGIITKSGDRDGLPNVVPEAMATGVIVIGSPVSGVVEAVRHEETGFLLDPKSPQLWVDLCRRLQGDSGLRLTVTENARRWVEREFMAERNTGRLLREIEKAIAAEQIEKTS